MHLLSMAGVAGCQTGVERVIGHRVCSALGCFYMIDMTIYTGDAALIMGRIGEIHAMFLMAIDAQCGDRISFFFEAGSGKCFERSAVWIMTSGAIHTALIVRAYFPILPAEARIAVTAPAQIGGAIHGHGSLGVIGGGGSMTGFAGHAVFFKGRSGRIVTRSMTNETSTRLALLGPLIQKYRVTTCCSMRSALPGGDKFSVAGGAVL